MRTSSRVSALPPVRRRLGSRAAAAAVICVALCASASCTGTDPIAGSAVPGGRPTTSSTTTAGGPSLTVNPAKAFTGVNYEPDPTFDEKMHDPRVLGAPTTVSGPSGSSLTLTVYAIDGFDYASRPLVPAAGTELRYVTVAWSRGQLTPAGGADAGAVTVVRDAAPLADSAPLELTPRPASQQDLPTSMYAWVVAVDPATDTAVVHYAITGGTADLTGSVRARDGRPS